MNDNNGFLDHSIFGKENIFNQDSTPLIGDENTALDIAHNIGAYIDPITLAGAEFSSLEEIATQPQFDQLEAQSSTPLLHSSFLPEEIDDFTGSDRHNSEIGTELISAFSSSTVSEGVIPAPEAESINLSRDYSIRAEGKVILRGRGDYDGAPLDSSDDARIYAGKGFAISGKPILPVQRDSEGNPLVDASNRESLVDKAVTVAQGYSTSWVSFDRYSGLIPPQIVEAQTIKIPDYEVTKQELLDSVLGDENVTRIPNYNLRNPNQWVNNFPAPGYSDNPTVVRVKYGGLTIPEQVDLTNYVIIAEQGDIK